MYPLNGVSVDNNGQCGLQQDAIYLPNPTKIRMIQWNCPTGTVTI